MDNRTTQRSISQVRYLHVFLLTGHSLTVLKNKVKLFWNNFISFHFIRIKRWGMDSYVYAPKDDYKHRAYWREMYTVEEADHLTSEFCKRI